MSRKVGQIIARGERRWLVRVYLGRDLQTRRRTYHDRTISGSLRYGSSLLDKEAARARPISWRRRASVHCRRIPGSLAENSRPTKSPWKNVQRLNSHAAEIHPPGDWQ